MTLRDDILRAELVDRRRRLDAAAQRMGAAHLSVLLREVDFALERMDAGTYGLCEACHDPIESERLIADPLVRFCLDHLTFEQQRALEEDLDMAARIQTGLLPEQNLIHTPWHVCYHYEASGPVSGDYCDLIVPGVESGAIFFLLGDVSGKGVAASMLMAHLHAIFRSLIGIGLPISHLIERANRVFCESTMPQHFATLVCGKLAPTGEVELCNAGHCQPLVLRRSGVSALQSSGLPLGLFSNSEYPSETILLGPGDTMFLYTDGISEAADRSGAEYGIARLSELLNRYRETAPDSLIPACLEDVSHFRRGAPMSDDLTVMAIQRVQ